MRRGRGLSAEQSSIGRSGRFRSPYALEFRQRPRNTLGFGPRTRKRPTRFDGRCGHSRRMRRQAMNLRQRSRGLIQKGRLWRGSICRWKPLLNLGLGTLELLYWAFFARQGARGKSRGPTAGAEVVQFLPKTLDPSMFAFEPFRRHGTVLKWCLRRLLPSERNGVAPSGCGNGKEPLRAARFWAPSALSYVLLTCGARAGVRDEIGRTTPFIASLETIHQLGSRLSTRAPVGRREEQLCFRP